MSRYEIYHEDYGLAFGNDHVCGEFLQIWKRPKDPEERSSQVHIGPDPEDICVDEDNETNFTKEKMLKFIAEYGFDPDELKRKKRGY